MQALRISLMGNSMIRHCCPSNREEVQKFMFLPEECMEQLLSKSYKDNDSEEYYSFY